MEEAGGGGGGGGGEGRVGYWKNRISAIKVKTEPSTVGNCLKHLYY